VPFGVSEVELAPDGKTVAGPAPMACVLRATRGRRVACGVVLGRGFLRCGEVYMAQAYKS
jgi:hypothetical protein